MVIESEPSLMKKLAMALDDDVFVVAEVSDYFEALWRMSEFKPDLVILDEKLPTMDGWEACRYISQTYGIPLIILGQETDSEVWAKAVAMGADFYLRMPCSPLVLAARIKAILRRYAKSG